MTTLDRPGSATVLPEEAAALIEVFVAGVPVGQDPGHLWANLRAWFGWTDAAGIDGLAAQRTHVEATLGIWSSAGMRRTRSVSASRPCPASTGGR